MERYAEEGVRVDKGEMVSVVCIPLASESTPRTALFSEVDYKIWRRLHVVAFAIGQHFRLQ
jgi:hypothetical protein